MTTTAPEMAYIAIAPCGCCHGVTVDRPDYAEYVAEDVSDWLKRGSAVERVTLSQARERLVTDCAHTPKWGRA